MAGRFFLGLLLFLGFLYPDSAETQSGSTWNTRNIAAQVLTDTVEGKAGDFIVLLTNQAPVLNLAASQPGRRSRRKSIMKALKQAAATGQPEITAELQRRKIPYRSFWIVNALVVRGNRELVEKLAGSIVDPPGLENSVITVGSVDSQRLMAGSSGRGPVTVDGSNRIKPDLVAPGVLVHSSYTESRYITWSGTSMAVPQVAGAAALLWSAFPSLIGQVDQTEALLKATAKISHDPDMRRYTS